jgi:Tfp pilus assembly protein PilX
MKKLTLGGEQGGFAALLVALVLVTVVALMTVGFAQLMRNEVNQATNRQLSTQAFYAAESGINDAVKALSIDPTISKDFCRPLTAAEAAGSTAKQYLTSNTVDGTNSQWTCLLIDSSPGSLVYGDVGRVSPTTFTVSAVDASGNPTSVGDITIYWQDASPSVKNFRNTSGTSTNTAFPPVGPAQWGNSTGVLRVAITAITTPFTRDSLRNNTFTAFLYPTKSSSTTTNSIAFSTAPDQQGSIVDSACNVGNVSKAPTPDPRYCSDTITGITASQVMFSLRSIYSDTSVYISPNSSTRLVGAQSLVDVTGRAQDVLKRIQVRIPSKAEFDMPGFDVESVNGVCKQLKLKPGTGNSDGCVY